MREQSQPLQINAAECQPLGDEKLQVRLYGSWRERARVPLERPMLVVVADGRKHRFPAIPQPRRSRASAGSDWSAGFTVPAWIGPRLEGNSSLHFGEVTFELTPALFAETLPVDEDVRSGDDLERAVPLEPPEAEAAAGQASPTRTGTGEEPIVVALRAELDQRTASEARLHAQLTAAQAELKARGGPAEELQATHAELRGELDRLAQAVEGRTQIESRALALAARVEELEAELAALREELAGVEVARTAAVGEAVALRAELDRLAAELAVSHERASERGGLAQAQALLAEARTLRERISSSS